MPATDEHDYRERALLGAEQISPVGQALREPVKIRESRDVECVAMTFYRVWPDGTWQEEEETPYSWMSDDYRIVGAESPEEALLLCGL